MKINIRPAVMKDAYEIKNLINSYAKKGKMLPVSINQVFENLRNFWVLCDSKDRVVGCGALKIVWKNLGEIRSLAVKEKSRKMGYGKQLVETLIQDAKKLGIEKVFVLTYVPEFFEKFGFQRIEKSKLPHKIWFDCINCPKFPRCDEIPMIKKI